MNKEEREKEKKLRRELYVKNELLKELKKEIMFLRRELNDLGNSQIVRKRKIKDK